MKDSGLVGAEHSPDIAPNDGSKARSKSRRSAHVNAILLVGIVESLILALVITRGILFHRGWILYSADFSIHMDRHTELANWAHSWNAFVGDDNSAVLSQGPPMLLLLRFFSTAWTQRSMLIVAYTVATGSSFFVMHDWLRNRNGRNISVVGAAVGAFAFTVNPWVAVESVHWFFLWLYALLPLTFYAIRRGLDAENGPGALGWGSVAGGIAIGTFTAYGIVFHALVGAVLGLAFLVFGRSSIRSRFKRIAQVALGYAVAAVALSMYWLVPLLFGFRNDFSQGTSWALFTTKDIFFLSPLTPPQFAITGAYRSVTDTLVGLAIGKTLAVAARLLGLSLALIIGIRAVLRARWRWEESGLIATILLALWLAKGAGPPGSNVYVRLTTAPVISRIAFVLLKGPYKVLSVVVFGLVMLALSSLTVLLARRGWRVVGIGLVVAAVGWAALGGSPLLSGDLNGYMKPVHPPAGYEASINAVGERLGDRPGRTAWLPIVSSTGSPSWWPHRVELPLLSGQVPPEAGWTSSEPISSRSVTWSGPASGRTFDYFLQRVIDEIPHANLDVILSGAGREAIVIQMDTSAGWHLKQQLLSHSELHMSYGDSYLSLFQIETKPALRGASAPGIVVGGWDTWVKDSIRSGSDGHRRNYVFSADLPPNPDFLIAQAPEIVFGPGKDWTDLALDGWTGPGFLTNAEQYVELTTPATAWDKDFFNSHLWLPSRLAGLGGSVFDPSRSPVFLMTNSLASVNIPVSGVSGSLEVWARVLVGPYGGPVVARFDATNLGRTDTYDSVQRGWQWLPLGTASGVGAHHSLALQVAGRLSAVDQVAVLPANAVTERVANLRRLTSHASISSVSVWSETAVATSSDSLLRRIAVRKNLAIRPVSGHGFSFQVGDDSSVEVDGFAHGVSGYWAVKLGFPRQDWSSAAALRLNVLGVQPVLLKDLTVRVLDGGNNFAQYSVSASAEGKGFTLALDHPDLQRDSRSQPVPRIEMENIVGIGFGYRARPNQRVAIKLVAVDLQRNTTRLIDAPRSGLYRLVLSSTSPLPGHVLVSGRSIALRQAAAPLVLSDVVALREGKVSLLFDRAVGSAAVLSLVTESGKVGTQGGSDAGLTTSDQRARDTSVVGVAGSAPFLLFRENYSPFWLGTESSNGRSATLLHVKTNGVINGYFVSRPGARLEVEFAPESSVRWGRRLSVIALILGILAWALATIARRRRLSKGR